MKFATLVAAVALAAAVTAGSAPTNVEAGPRGGGGGGAVFIDPNIPPWLLYRLQQQLSGPQRQAVINEIQRRRRMNDEIGARNRMGQRVGNALAGDYTGFGGDYRAPQQGADLIYNLGILGTEFGTRFRGRGHRRLNAGH